ncbi:hypothetical protein ACJ2_32610 [Pantoea sp. QMID2]|nr:hypothetical protein ACJ3_16860 [Pantoea sp. QMID3]GME36405.1 hypothetical protein ACJ1_16760 [Pantoea sp. QMID1]GME59222.1 hypothetical protein ACJ4_32530 [Pantoea sp. QMID4]GME60719.1 hypothetical protein ACJ2_32610 [Pantoea sp. QMID2]
MDVFSRLLAAAAVEEVVAGADLAAGQAVDLSIPAKPCLLNAGRRNV